MPNYNNGKIYKIIGGGLTYIGSTTQRLNTRFLSHKCEKKLRPNKKCSSFKLLDYEDCKIELIENYPCENNNQLRERERYWYNLIENVNIIKPIRTINEIKEYNKEYHKNYDKIKGKDYYENNKEIVKKKVKEYQLKFITCECGCEIKRGNLYKHRITKKHLENIINLNSKENV